MPACSLACVHRSVPWPAPHGNASVLGTDFLVQHTQIQSLTLQAPYLLYVDHGDGRESVPIEQSEYTSSYLRVSKEEPSDTMAKLKTVNYWVKSWTKV